MTVVLVEPFASLSYLSLESGCQHDAVRRIMLYVYEVRKLCEDASTMTTAAEHFEIPFKELNVTANPITACVAI
jgi:hypothetical protein